MFDDAIEEEIIFSLDDRPLQSIEHARDVFQKNTEFLNEPYNVTWVVSIISEWGEPVVILLDDHARVVYRYEHDMSDL
jgi:hypothetical protein